MKKHNTADSLWVTYQGGVYDVTNFVGIHPGGADLLLSAGGLDLAPFWDMYLVHLYKGNGTALPYLESHQIGRLSSVDQEAVESESYAEVQSRSIEKGKEISSFRGYKVLGVLMMMPMLYLLRKLGRFLGMLGLNRLVEAISTKVCFCFLLICAFSLSL